MAEEKKEPRNPIQIFIAWFNSLPEVQQAYLAHMYWICTTEDTVDFALEVNESIRKFRHFVLRSDFPLRMLSRIVVVRGVIDFILHNKKLLSRIDPTNWIDGERLDAKVVPISEKQWEKTVASWRQLIKTDLSDKAISMWVDAITQ